MFDFNDDRAFDRSCRLRQGDGALAGEREILAFSVEGNGSFLILHPSIDEGVEVVPNFSSNQAMRASIGISEPVLPSNCHPSPGVSFKEAFRSTTMSAIFKEVAICPVIGLFFLEESRLKWRSKF